MKNVQVKSFMQQKKLGIKLRTVSESIIEIEVLKI